MLLSLVFSLSCGTLFILHAIQSQALSVVPSTSQLCRASHTVTIKYVGPVVIYKIIDPHNHLPMTLDGKILRGLFEHERLKPVNIRMSQGNVQI